MIETLSRQGEGTATVLAADLSISRQAASKHLRQLVDAGLLTARRTGRETKYRPVPAALRQVVEWVDQVDTDWRTRLRAIENSLTEN
jgi:DNA-binding transcriptional ArsR family regulator